jgi:inner membrane transporter RhtA
MLMITAMLSFQLGAAVATGLFDQIGVPTTAFLRNTVGGLLLAVVARPRLHRPPAELAWLVVFGLQLAVMILAFYAAILRIPLGVAVTIEFVGPLTVALVGSRRPRDIVWVVLAGSGIAIFAGLPTSGSLSTLGIAFALLAGVAWGGYIFTAQRVGRSWSGSEGVAAGILASAVFLAPMGIGGITSVSPSNALTIAALGVLSAALPFSLDMAALRRLTTRAFGILASLEPIIATVVGVAALGQHLHPSDALATLLVVSASIGAATEQGP